MQGEWEKEKWGGGRIEQEGEEGVDGRVEMKPERLQVQGKRRRESVAK